MRHTVHMMLGAETGRYLCDLKQYVIKYGSPGLQRYFKAVHYREEGDDACEPTYRDGSTVNECWAQKKDSV